MTIGESVFSCLMRDEIVILFWREIRGCKICAWLSTADGFMMLNESQHSFGKLQRKLILFLLKITIML